MAPWNNRTSQSSGVIGKAITDHLEEGEILLKDVLISRSQALALTDQRLMHLTVRNSFLRRSVRMESIPLRRIRGIEIDDLCPHYINGTRPSGFKLRLIDSPGKVIIELFGENDAIDTAIQLLLELQLQVYLLSDRELLPIPSGQAESSLPGELGRKVNFMLEDGEPILGELPARNGRAVSATDRRLILVRADREHNAVWGRHTVIEIPYSRLDRILTSSEIVNPQIVMHMSLYFETFGQPLPGGKAEHVNLIGAYWTDILELAMLANAMKHSRHSSYVASLY